MPVTTVPSDAAGGAHGHSHGGVPCHGHGAQSNSGTAADEGGPLSFAPVLDEASGEETLNSAVRRRNYDMVLKRLDQMGSSADEKDEAGVPMLHWGARAPAIAPRRAASTRSHALRRVRAASQRRSTTFRASRRC